MGAEIIFSVRIQSDGCGLFGGQVSFHFSVVARDCELNRRHAVRGARVSRGAVFLDEFIIAVDVPTLLVLVVEGGEHEAGDIRQFVDIRFVFGDGVEARLEDSVLRHENQIAFLNFDVVVGYAVVDAVEAGGDAVAHEEVPACRAVDQGDAARIYLISSEFVFGEGNVHVIGQLINEQVAAVAQVVGGRARNFLRDDLLVEQDDFFEDIVNLLYLRFEVFVLRADLLLKFGGRRLKNVA